MILALLLISAAPDLLAQFECNRCHDGTGLDDPPLEKRCVECHRRITAGTFPAKSRTLARWQKNLHSLPDAPSLVAAKRLRSRWIERFLLAPNDVRPALEATMPRLPLSNEQARELADHLGSNGDDPPIAGDLWEGQKLYQQLKCGTCHQFSGSTLAGQNSAPLAPDLAKTRERMTSEMLLAYLKDPQRFDPSSKMPSFELSETQRINLAAFIHHLPLINEAKNEPKQRLPLLKRRVSFEEVSARVLKKVCWHCHSTPDYARGDGGPGNSGGFGYKSKGLDLSSYEGIAAGSIGDQGERRSIFTPLDGGTPRLVAVLLARGEEELGKNGTLIGMPLGLPSLTSEDIQLVESWVAQGRPR